MSVTLEVSQPERQGDTFQSPQKALTSENMRLMSVTLEVSQLEMFASKL